MRLFANSFLHHPLHLHLCVFLICGFRPSTPSNFVQIGIFNELKFALSVLPDAFIQTYQTIVSLKRIEKYLHSAEITPDCHVDAGPSVALKNATVTWPQAGFDGSATSASGFSLVNINVQFPKGELSLVCGKLGSGKTLLLLGLSFFLRRPCSVAKGS
jgi:ABC-type siderophore export system fused ATPase/permease subunit